MLRREREKSSEKSFAVFRSRIGVSPCEIFGLARSAFRRALKRLVG
jgi:hypothetical protein